MSFAHACSVCGVRCHASREGTVSPLEGLGPNILTHAVQKDLWVCRLPACRAEAQRVYDAAKAAQDAIVPPPALSPYKSAQIITSTGVHIFTNPDEDP